MKTTLNKIRAHRPCRFGWEKLLRGLGKTQPDDEIIWIDQILDTNNLDDALWCLRAVEGCDREIRLYAVWCARHVQPLMADPRSVAALDVVERHVSGEASDEELASAAAAAMAWAAAASMSSARAAMASAMSSAMASAMLSAMAARAAWAAAAMSDAAEAAGARDTERAAQAEELRRVCREMREVQS